MASTTAQKQLHLETDALLQLGLRAAWLHLTLTGRRGIGLSPRDRTLLCLVATAGPNGLDAPDLVTAAVALGITGAAASRRTLQLADQDLLSPRGSGFDLPAADLRWIARQMERLTRDRGQQP